MKDRVEIVDDTLRTTRGIVNASLGLQLSRDYQGRRIQDERRVTHVFEGLHLQQAIKRAKRWMRGPRFRAGEGAPHSIALAMAAFHKADPKGFQEALLEVKGKIK